MCCLDTACDLWSRPRPWIGEHVPWMGPWIYPLVGRMQHIQAPPSVYFIPFSNSSSALSMLLAYPTLEFFTLFVDFLHISNKIEYGQRSTDGNYPRIACNIHNLHHLLLVVGWWLAKSTFGSAHTVTAGASRGMRMG